MRLLVLGFSALMLIAASTFSAYAQSCDAKCLAFCAKNHPRSEYCIRTCTEKCNRRH